ncbi:hypothetical protein [Nocardia asiatica]|uniref:hypothetical protein n=1 Tax=Nocardia asiatica TaxID=209252 RepID=UPI0024581AB3|nr:hypothetical protein [Nocardia asiatica]
MAGRRVGASLAAETERRVVELRRLDDSIGGRELYPVVSKELAAAQAVVRDGSHSTVANPRM